MAEIPDVVASETIAVEWGNDIRDRTVQRYNDVATRTSENASPGAGDLAYMEDTGDLAFYHGGAWKNFVPTGSVFPFAGSSAPTGYVFAQGQAISRTTYAALFAVLGTTYGVGDGSTTFNVPQLRQRFPIGVASSGTADDLGETGGAIDHTHTGPSHTHNVDVAQFNSGADGGHDHDLSDGYAKWTTTPTETQFVRISTEDWTATRDANTNLLPNTVSATTNSGTELGGTTGSEGNHTHTVNPPTTASGAGGTGATGTNNPPYIALHFIIKT